MNVERAPVYDNQDDVNSNTFPEQVQYTSQMQTFNYFFKSNIRRLFY